MAEVILIGDSIRMGYQETVREELKGVAEVWMPEKNGGNSRNILANLKEWAVSRKPAVVHINCGLHDLKKEFGAEETAVPLAEYRENVEEILQALLRETDARVIWATTTPVNTEWHHARKGFDRFEADVDAYNREAVAICNRLDIPVDDLYEVIVRAGRDELLREDGVHFKEEGSELLGRAVAEAIQGYL